MRLIEPIFSKRLHELEDLLDCATIDATGCRTLIEVCTDTLQHVFLLLSDSPAECVRLRTTEACKRNGGRHYVLLEDEDPMGALQHRFKEWMRIGDRLLSVLATDVGGDARHRPRPIEGHHGGNVENARRAQLLDVAAHPWGLQLEHACRFAGRQEGKGLGVIKRNLVEINLNAAGLADAIDRRSEDRQVRQAEEVKLQQAERLHSVHLNLRHHSLRVRRTLQRHNLSERLATDHHAGGVR